MMPRSRAADFLMSQPDVRLGGWFAGIASGDTLTLAVRTTEERVCAEMGAREVCASAFPIERAWAAMYSSVWPNWLRIALDVGFVAGLLAVVVGVVPAGTSAWVYLLPALAGLCGAVVLGARPGSLSSILIGVAMGSIAGVLLRRLASREGGPS